MKSLWLWVPLALFVAVFGVVATGLMKPDDQLHPSKMIGRPMPAFALPAGSSAHPGLARADLAGRPRLLNIFASWCVPCVAEAPVLASMARQGVVIDGIAIRDRPQDVDRFLAQNGDPYRAIGSDIASQVQLSIGSSGVPETFVIDGQGVIRHQHIGAVTEGDVPELLARLRAAQ